ncbi:MAG: ferrous iron transport protein B, partial [Candidatus Marinimicrobia bacterium]|nr:ferrous iron transport protein B [Candidatus Neomarinimicrobiota bacterium]
MAQSQNGNGHITASDEKTIALVGNPNVGKSVLFGNLTGSYVTVSNYPGTTVEVTRGKWNVDGKGGGLVGGDDNTRVLIDTPGINNLIPSSEDELVTRNILLTEKPENVLQVIDAKNLRRGLLITLQMIEMGVPFSVCLNMLDEAQSRGIEVNARALSELLGVDVIGTVATRKQGMDAVKKILRNPRVAQYDFTYTDHIEASLERIGKILESSDKDLRISSRSIGLMLLAGDDTLYEFLEDKISEDQLEEIRAIVAETEAIYPESLHNIITRIRLDEAQNIIQSVMTSEAPEGEGFTQKLGRWSMHPVWGLPVLLAVLFFMYQFVGVFGAGTLVDFLESVVFGEYISPWVSTAVEWLIPMQFFIDMFVGEYGLLTMALSYSVAIVLPIVGTFFIAFGILEDSGYLPRLAVMVNRFFKVIGLNGKAILPMVLGLGCDTMATLTTRILDSKKERVIVTLLLALGVPCSAQLGVILGMLSGLSLGASVLWAGIVAGVLLLV